ncbi:MAG: hypothetical protein Q4F67_09815 [Propionibacteriaceae bacterium]|nr:hypothetical protein [Propionibacteriaceae bacterium]
MKLARPRITAGIGLLLTTALTVTACGEPTTPATAPSASLPAANLAAA